MDNKNTDILHAYGLDDGKMTRTRGAFSVMTDQGLFMLREYGGTAGHLEREESIQQALLARSRLLCTDRIIRTEEGDLFFNSDNGKSYVVRKWYPTTDLDPTNRQHLQRAVSALAELHNILEEVLISGEQTVTSLTENEFERHNRELKKTRNFIRAKRKKNDFELMVLDSFDRFYEEGLEACRLAGEYHFQEYLCEEQKRNRWIHGDCNYHNLLLTAGKTEKVLITGLDKVRRGIPIRDLYDFMRKVMEKNSWNQKLGESMVEKYREVRKGDAGEWYYLWLKFSYPEKYWKLLNHYYNHNKAWIPDKDYTKLSKVVEEFPKRRAFTGRLQKILTL